MMVMSVPFVGSPTKISIRGYGPRLETAGPRDDKAAPAAASMRKLQPGKSASAGLAGETFLPMQDAGRHAQRRRQSLPNPAKRDPFYP
jgi:hypothetical protein